MDMINILGDEGLALSTDILTTQGRIRYLKDWGTEITDHLKELNIGPGNAPIIERPSPTSQTTDRYQLTITRTPATRGRRFDYAGLRAQKPRLYQSHVTVMAPDAPLTLTYPRATVWNELRSQGWQSASADYAAKKAAAPATLMLEASRLSDIRLELRDLAHREKAARIRLAELITERDRTVRPYTYRDGFIRVSQSALRQSIDLDAAEQSPELRKFISYHDVKPVTRVWFKHVDDETDEGY